MKFGVPKERFAGERRVALTPESVGRLQKLGYECLVETGAGDAARFSDAAYEAAGARVVPDAAALWAKRISSRRSARPSRQRSTSSVPARS